MGNLEAAIIKVAGTQLEVRELTGNNDGPAVESYLKAVGLGKGYSWCMAFVYWCTKNAAVTVHQQNPLKQTGGVLDEWHSGRGQHIDTPEPGCIMIMDHGGGQGHTGIVTGVFLDKGYIHTIEGNTNTNGGREGIGVFRKTRMLKGDKIIGYIKLADIPL